MKILLVNPHSSNWTEGRSDKTAAAVRMPPVGILTIAAHLLSEGHPVKLLDLSAMNSASAVIDFTSIVTEFSPQLIGFTTVTSSFHNAYHLATVAKELSPDSLTVFGGVHVSALRASILSDYPAIDLVVAGEGERAMAEIASGVDFSLIQGLVYRDGESVRDNGVRSDLFALDSLPLPAYHLLDGFPHKYEGPLFNYPKAPTAAVISSRGCPYECSYCDRSVFRSSFRFNSAAYLYNHVSYLNSEFGIRHIFFYDDLFTFNRKRIEDFCNLLLEKPLGITFNCAVRVGHIDDELLRLLKKAGCWMVSLGIESGAPEMLARHKSNVSFDEMKDTVARIRKSGLRAKGLFMMGLPGETEETIRMTTDFINRLELDDMNMTKFTPFPGAPLYKCIHEEGVFDERWELMNCMNFVFVPNGISSREHLDKLYREFIQGFYTGKNWMRKFPGLMFKSPDSVKRIIRNLPTFLKIRQEFKN